MGAGTSVAAWDGQMCKGMGEAGRREVAEHWDGGRAACVSIVVCGYWSISLRVGAFCMCRLLSERLYLLTGSWLAIRFAVIRRFRLTDVWGLGRDKRALSTVYGSL